MPSILKPSKIEYVSDAVNWIGGCYVDCIYCYMKGMDRRFGIDSERSNPRALFADPVTTLRNDLARRTSPVTGPILLSSSHDPVSTIASDHLLGIIQVLGEFGLLGKVLLLSKRPMLALSVLGGVGASAGLRIGTSLTTLGSTMARQYEPLAEPPAVRLSAIRQAAEAGYNTWISMEPPLPYVWIHRMIEEIDLDQMGRPWVVLGKLSYQGENDELRDWAKSGHWRGDRDKARGNLTAQGYTESMVPQSGSYYIKNNLAVAI